jgi:hypothetical protein
MEVSTLLKDMQTLEHDAKEACEQGDRTTGKKSTPPRT